MKMRIAFLSAFVFLMAASAHAQRFVKQATATTINFHFTTISTGADTASPTITGVTISFLKQSDTLSSTSVNVTAAVSGSSNDCVYVTKGMLNCEITAVNTDTLGRFDAVASFAGSYSDPISLHVVSAGFWDLMQTGPGDIDDILNILGTPAGASLAADISTRGTHAVKRNTGFQWGIQMMTSAGVPVTTGTPVCTRAIDSPTFAATANSPTALSADGFTELILSNADMNGTDYVILKCTVATARNYYTIFKLEAP